MQTSSQMNNTLRWFENSAFDNPTLKSPQPCKRGIFCDYRRFDKESQSLQPACCRGVHPGEEGTGRRLFPARTIIGNDGQEIQQTAVVRLTGANNGYYMRQKLRLSWQEWCEREGISTTPCEPGVPYTPVTISPIGKRNTPLGPRKNGPSMGGSQSRPPMVSQREPVQMATRPAANSPLRNLSSQPYLKEPAEGTSIHCPDLKNMLTMGGGGSGGFTPLPPGPICLKISEGEAAACRNYQGEEDGNASPMISFTCCGGGCKNDDEGGNSTPMPTLTRCGGGNALPRPPRISFTAHGGGYEDSSDDEGGNATPMPPMPPLIRRCGASSPEASEGFMEAMD